MDAAAEEPDVARGRLDPVLQVLLLGLQLPLRLLIPLHRLELGFYGRKLLLLHARGPGARYRSDQGLCVRWHLPRSKRPDLFPRLPEPLLFQLPGLAAKHVLESSLRSTQLLPLHACLLGERERSPELGGVRRGPVHGLQHLACAAQVPLPLLPLLQHSAAQELPVLRVVGQHPAAVGGLVGRDPQPAVVGLRLYEDGLPGVLEGDRRRRVVGRHADDAPALARDHEPLGPRALCRLLDQQGQGLPDRLEHAAQALLVAGVPEDPARLAEELHVAVEGLLLRPHLLVQVLAADGRRVCARPLAHKGGLPAHHPEDLHRQAVGVHHGHPVARAVVQLEDLHVELPQRDVLADPDLALPGAAPLAERIQGLRGEGLLAGRLEPGVQVAVLRALQRVDEGNSALDAHPGKLVHD
mmetsp:Transcript_44004/g.137805  ORF Transcript_44004/g.137805 Transcript_44004/m.137805 type:complete len:411 (+) Transcript_44004:538-1770(+)